MPKVFAIVEKWTPAASHRDRFEPGRWVEAGKSEFSSPHAAATSRLLEANLELPGMGVKFYTEADPDRVEAEPPTGAQLRPPGELMKLIADTIAVRMAEPATGPDPVLSALGEAEAALLALGYGAQG